MEWGARATALCLATGLMGGCAGGEHFFTPSAGGGGSTFGNLLAFNTTDPGPVPKAADKEPPLQCPTIEVLDGTSSLRSYGGADQSNGDVKYQYSMGDVARECSKSGNQVLIKVGVEGRVLLGPVGKAGSFTVPVRIAIRRDSDEKAVSGKLYDVPVTIPFGQTEGQFSVVTEPLAVPYIQAHADADYTILVGFDEKSNAPATAKPPRGKRRNGGAG